MCFYLKYSGPLVLTDFTHLRCHAYFLKCQNKSKKGRSSMPGSHFQFVLLPPWPWLIQNALWNPVCDGPGPRKAVTQETVLQLWNGAILQCKGGETCLFFLTFLDCFKHFKKQIPDSLIQVFAGGDGGGLREPNPHRYWRMILCTECHWSFYLLLTPLTKWPCYVSMVFVY